MEGNEADVNVASSSLASVLELKKNEGKSKKKVRPGVVYLSTIPPTFNLRQVKEFFDNFGSVGRVHLAVNERRNPRARISSRYSEGWVEFLDKRDAKKVAVNLNAKQVGLVGGKKKKSKYYDSLWSIKYLNRFKWGHLTDQLHFEKAAHDQRMRNEIAQAKRETNFYIDAVNRNSRQQKFPQNPAMSKKNVFQRQTVDETQKRLEGENGTMVPFGPSLTLLQSIFSGGQDDEEDEP